MTLGQSLILGERLEPKQSWHWSCTPASLAGRVSALLLGVPNALPVGCLRKNKSHFLRKSGSGIFVFMAQRNRTRRSERGIKNSNNPRQRMGQRRHLERWRRLKLEFSPVWGDAGRLSWTTPIPRECPAPKAACL